MRQRLHLMGNGYAGEILDLIIIGKSVISYLSIYDYSILKNMAHTLNGVSLVGNLLTVTDRNGTFETTIVGLSDVRNLEPRFQEKYRTVAYLMYDELLDSGYLLTEEDARLLI